MARSLPPLAWFRAFESAARHLSFTAAADELSLTQSAVSQNVRALELRLGQRLFQRKARGLALTDAGRRLVPSVTSAIGELAAATELFAPGGDEGLLTVATRNSFAQAVLAPRLHGFLAANPGLRVRFVSTLWPDNDLASGADLEIRLGAPDLVGKGASRLLDDRVLPVWSPDLLAARAPVAALLAQPLIQAVGSSDTWETWAKSAAAGPPPPASRLVDSYGLALELAAHGCGVALVSRLLAGPRLRAGSLRTRPGLATPARDTFYLARREDPPGSPAQRFEHWLRAEIEGGVKP